MLLFPFLLVIFAGVLFVLAYGLWLILYSAILA